MFDEGQDLMTHSFSRRNFLLASALGMFAPGFITDGSLAAATGVFPNVSGENLNGKTFSFPQDFAAERTLILFAYEREQAQALTSWIEGLALRDKSISWFEMPIISSPYRIGSFIIDRGMRSGIPDPKIRERVVTIYTNQALFSQALGIPFEKSAAYALIVDRRGKNLGFVTGAYTPAKAAIILRLLKTKDRKPA